MNKLVWVLVASFILFTNNSPAQKIKLNSPNKEIIYSFEVKNGIATYSITFKNKVIIKQSGLSLQFDSFNFQKNITAGKATFLNNVEDYELITGKAKKIHHLYHQVIIPLKNKEASSHQINLIV